MLDKKQLMAQMLMQPQGLPPPRHYAPSQDLGREARAEDIQAQVELLSKLRSGLPIDEYISDFNHENAQSWSRSYGNGAPIPVEPPFGTMVRPNPRQMDMLPPMKPRG